MNTVSKDKMQGKIAVIGQAPPRVPSEQPFARTRLFQWLETIGVSKNEVLERFRFFALVDTFPGRNGSSHKPPSRHAIEAFRPLLVQQIKDMAPTAVVPLGGLAIRECLQDDTIGLHEAVGQVFIQNPLGALSRKLPIIPLPHPSGASPWIHLDGNGTRLKRALGLLQLQFGQGEAA